MTASGSLATLSVAELLQIAALSRKRGTLRLRFSTGRRIVVYVHDGNLGGLTDTARTWHLGDLLASTGRLADDERKRLLIDARLRGKRLGQLLVERGHVSRDELEGLLRRLILHSLLYAVENESQGEFELEVGHVQATSVTFPIADFLIEISSCIDEFARLRAELGAGSGAIALEPGLDLADTLHRLSYRQVQVVAQVDGRKTPMQSRGGRRPLTGRDPRAAGRARRRGTDRVGELGRKQARPSVGRYRPPPPPRTRGGAGSPALTDRPGSVCYTAGEAAASGTWGCSGCGAVLWRGQRRLGRGTFAGRI